MPRINGETQEVSEGLIITKKHFITSTVWLRERVNKGPNHHEVIR